MPESDPTRLDDLKRRWAQDPGSRLYLQLADEHRKHGQLEAAESVLLKGLEHRPSDLSGLVALGRCRLELGKVGAAIASLEAVTARDPAHMVASKLLVEAHLQRSDAENAEEHLTTCRLLNDRDPELEGFERRLKRLRGGAPKEPPAAPPEPVSPPAFVAPPKPAAAVPAAAPPVEPAAAAAAAAPSNGGQIFHLGAVPAAPSLEALWREPPRRRPAEPFRGLIPGAAAFAQGEIFRVDEAPSGSIEVEPPLTAPVATVAAAPEAVDDEPPTEKIEIQRPLITLAEEAPAAAETLAEEPSPAEEAPAEEAPAEEAPAEVATVTLGGLYLKQGHREEAARIFERVLEREPDNPAALAGLNLTQSPQPSPPLTAIDLLADRSLSGTLPMGLTAKKLLVLGNYLQHIRNARERDHVH